MQTKVFEPWSCAHQTDEINEIAELCKFDDIDILTAFADYRIPQSLAHLGVIRYSDELTDILKSTKLKFFICSVFNLKI